jgi:hypothetical protein
MAVDLSVTLEQWLTKQIETGDPDLLRSMVKTMAESVDVGRGRQPVRGRVRRAQ